MIFSVYFDEKTNAIYKFAYPSIPREIRHSQFFICRYVPPWNNDQINSHPHLQSRTLSSRNAQSNLQTEMTRAAPATNKMKEVGPQRDAFVGSSGLINLRQGGYSIKSTLGDAAAGLAFRNTWPPQIHQI